MARQSWFSGNKVSREQAAHYLYQAGFRGADLAKMVAIAERESGYDPGAHGSDQPRERVSGDRGLWQINSVHDQALMRAGIISNKRDLFDPATNARAAKFLYDQGGLYPWGAAAGGWTSGGNPLYGTNLAAAQAATDRYLANPSQYAQGAVPAEEFDTERQPSEPVATEEPEVDPEQQAALSDLLSGFGVDYANAPRPTPALLAFLRGLGMTLDTAEDVRRQTEGRIQTTYADSMADLERADQRTRQNITGDLQRRGVLRSGEANTRYARQAEDVADRQFDIERSRAEGIEDAGNIYESLRDRYRQTALETTLTEEQRQATAKATSEAQAQALADQQAEADLAWERQRQAQQEYLQRMEQLYAQYGA